MEYDIHVSEILATEGSGAVKGKFLVWVRCGCGLSMIETRSIRQEGTREV